MRRRLGLGGLGILVLLAGGYTAWWYVLSRRVEAGFAAWAAARRTEGWTVGVGAVRLAGWPNRAGIDLSDLRITGGAPELPLAVDWEAAGLRLLVAPFHPASLAIQPRGEQRVGVPGGPALALAGTLRGRIPLDRAAPPWPLEVVAEGLRLRPTRGGADAVIGRAAAHSALDPTASAASPALAVTFDIQRIDLPPDRSWPLGGHVEAVGGEIAISGPVPKPASAAARAEAWRDAGGTAALRQGTLRWGPLDASASARASLDPALQPVADGTARITGWPQALDVLAAHHVIPDAAALTAKAVVSLLAETPPSGGQSVLTAPFSVRDGVLSAREIPLARVPTLDWPTQGQDAGHQRP
ncbi:MAG TPA: DUF2125 domain-containing protein [Acetobacteraceae bacterium]|nr:DUF2125 domain-containing protein [Acetobacteraceae bacterium]